jgi:type IV pilus assembly protein PilB
MEKAKPQILKLFPLLCEKKVVDKKELQKFSALPSFELFNILKNNFQVPEEKLLELISKETSIPFKKIENLTIDLSFFNEFEKTSLEKYDFLPVYRDKKNICVALNNPYNIKTLEYLQNKFCKEIKIILITSADLNAYLGIKTEENKIEYTILDDLLVTALGKKASDIHISQENRSFVVKNRIVGDLHLAKELSLEKGEELVSLIKYHAGLDISKKLLAQDGRISYTYQGIKYDIRVASLPTVYGEDFVLRLFNVDKIHYDFSELGFTKPAIVILKRLLKYEAGLILVTGPTGSGKTTTLYSCLEYLKQDHKKNIVSLEDPVECIIKGVRQSQINLQAGHTFPNGLKAILRQDPDIIMVGEIRDHKTAKIALDAAYTGHLVLSTLHTTDVESTLFRLKGFDLDPFVVRHSLKGVVSQKLRPKLCPACLGQGCKECHYTKNDGRIVLSELLEITNKEQDYEFDALIKKNVYYSFEQDIKNKVERGLISNADNIG